MKIKKISIIGVGFMGASLALAIKDRFASVSLWGYARSRKSFNKLKSLKLVDEVTMDLKELISHSDIVVLSVPALVIIDYFKKIRPFLKKGAFVIDLGSTKKMIVDKASRYLPGYVNFVGCHPLCGSDKSGPAAADSDLYRKSLCLITSRAKTSVFIEKFWQKLGCRVCRVDPSAHDEILSYVSHLPHLLSFSLTSIVPERYLKFASGSFRDLTRISSSPAEVWADIFVSNSANLIKSLRRYVKTLKTLEKIIADKDRARILAFIKKVNSRQKITQP